MCAQSQGFLIMPQLTGHIPPSVPSFPSSKSITHSGSWFYVHSVSNFYLSGRSAHLLNGLNAPCPLNLLALPSCVNGIRKHSPEKGFLYKGPLVVPGRLLYNRNLGGLPNRPEDLNIQDWWLLRSQNTNHKARSNQEQFLLPARENPNLLSYLIRLSASKSECKFRGGRESKVMSGTWKRWLHQALTIRTGHPWKPRHGGATDWSGIYPTHGLCFSPHYLSRSFCVPSPGLHPGDKKLNQMFLEK